MNEQNKANGIWKLSTFLTADALLAAVLLVWGQIWMQSALQLWAKYYRPENGGMEDWFFEFNTSASAGFIFTYLPVLLLLIALAWAGWKSLTSSQKNRTPTFAIGLFMASLILGILNVMQSLLNVGIKLLKFTLEGPTNNLVFETFAPPELGWPSLVGGFILLLGIVLVPILGMHRLDKNIKQEGLIRDYLFWKIEILLVLTFVILWVVNIWHGLGYPYNVILLLLIGIVTVVVIICFVLKKLRVCKSQ